MKTLYYKTFTLLLMIPLLTLAGNGKMKGKYTKEKTLKKEFAVNNDALLKINNNYGNLDITSWNENRIVMEINIKVNGNDEEYVIEKLENIDVDFEASASRVSARTTYGEKNESWWSKLKRGWNSNNLKMEINYIVKVPATNMVDLDNDYGSITLDTIKGNAKISCDYGQILLGELLADDNYIKIDYTNNSSIKYMKSGKINADYSDFNLKKSESIELSADYSKSKFGMVKDLNYNCDYGDLQVQNVDKIIGIGDYLDTDIDVVNQEANLNSDYGSIDINMLMPNTKSVVVKTDYVGVEIGYHSDYNFDFVIKSSYGGIKLDEDIELMKQIKQNSKKHYEGYRGQKNNGNSININASYGSIKLNRN